MVLNHTDNERDSERGVTIVITALTLSALMVIAAFAIDLGYARQVARNNQATTDGSSLAAARDLPTSSPSATMANEARLAAQANIASSLNGAPSAPCAPGVNPCTFTIGDHTITIETPYVLAGSTIPSHNLVRVEDCHPSPAFFSKVVGASDLEVCRSAVARNVQVQEGFGIGIIALEPSLQCAIRINGNNTVTVEGGAVLANSTGNPAICGSSPSGCGNMTINAALVSAVGTISDCVEDKTQGQIVENAQAVADPFAGLPESPCHAPAAVPCTGTPARPTAVGVCSTSGMQPGYFASSCSLSGGPTATDMAPGVYWFNNGFDPGNKNLHCSTCSSANGGVLMYFHNGSFGHTGNGNVNLLPYQASQPQGDLYAGLSIYQRRGNLSPLTVGGTAGNGIGSIYAKGAEIRLHGNVTRTVDGIIVGGDLDFNGNTTTTVNPPPGGPQTDPIVDLGLER